MRQACLSTVRVPVRECSLFVCVCVCLCAHTYYYIVLCAGCGVAAGPARRLSIKAIGRSKPFNESQANGMYAA
jgi:hypothetical protein